MKFSDALTEDHRSINRVHVGVVQGALGRDFHDWRTPQVADFVRLRGSGRFGPGQTEQRAYRDLEAVVAETCRRFPGLRGRVIAEKRAGQPVMPAFEVSRDARIVQAINAAYKSVRGVDQPTGAITPPGYYGTDAGHLYAELGMEGVVCGPGGRYNTMPDERVDIADYLDMVRIYLLTIGRICEFN